MVLFNKSASQCQQHDCGDTRLRCIDCNSPVCPQCWVACPVGNRCPQCAGVRPTASQKQAAAAAQAPWRFVAAALFLGVMFGWQRDVVDFSFFIFVFYVVFFAAGRAAGQQLRRHRKEYRELYTIASFLLGDAAAIAYSCLAAHLALASWTPQFIPFFIDTACVAIGLFLGCCGFG